MPLLLRALSPLLPALGYRVRYIASDALLADLGASLADGTMPKRIRYYTRFDLLVIDGFGFDKIERQEVPQALSLLFKVVDKRNARSSTALISNIDLDLWNEYLGDAPMVMALIDRLMERAIIMRFPKARSYRAHSARQFSPTGAQPAAGGGGRDRSQASRQAARRNR